MEVSELSQQTGVAVRVRVLTLGDAPRLVRTRFDVGDEKASARVINPFFSRSGDEIFYTIQESPDETTVFAKPADGFGQPHNVPAPEGFNVAHDRSTDGRYLAVVGRPRDGKIVNMWLWRSDGRAPTARRFIIRGTLKMNMP